MNTPTTHSHTQNFKCIVNIREVRKQKFYGDDSCPSQSQSSAGDLGDITEIEGQRKGKLDRKVKFNGKLNGCTYKCRMYSHMHVCSSAHSNGCEADGSHVMTAI